MGSIVCSCKVIQHMLSACVRLQRDRTLDHPELEFCASVTLAGWLRQRDFAAKSAVDFRSPHGAVLRYSICAKSGQNKTRRIYRELGLQLRNKTPKRRVKAKLRDDRRLATRSNETGAMDFVHDQLASGHRLRALTIVDTFSRFSPALAPRFTFRGTDVVEVLERACKEVGFPATCSLRMASGFTIRAPTTTACCWACPAS